MEVSFSANPHMTITPTQGRVVWFWPFPGSGGQIYPDLPFRADVCCCHPTGLVNLSVTDHFGDTFPVHGVREASKEEVEGNIAGGMYSWMPYQQAVKKRFFEVQEPPNFQPLIEKAVKEAFDNHFTGQTKQVQVPETATVSTVQAPVTSPGKSINPAGGSSSPTSTPPVTTK